MLTYQTGERAMIKLDERQLHCIENAVYFTAIRGRRPATRVRAEFPTIIEAAEYAAQFRDKRTMIYAVTADGSSDHIINI